MTPFTTVLVALAQAEHAAWNGHVEGDAAMTPRLQSYYAACGYPPRRARSLARQAGNDTTAWSAAFISYLFQTAGAGAAFPVALNHATYVTSLKGNMTVNGADFVAFPLGGIQAAAGDVICKWRDADENTPGVQQPRIHGRRVSFNAINPNSYRFFKSHCDLIVDINGNNATGIGGNVGNTVATTPYVVNAAGFITHARGVALIKNFR